MKRKKFVIRHNYDGAFYMWCVIDKSNEDCFAISIYRWLQKLHHRSI